MSIPQSKSSSNGFPLKRGETEEVLHKTNTSNTVFNGEAGSLKRLSLDRLVYFTTCKIGHHVEVHLRNGSVYTGIFHAANVEKDFGIILKMACLIKDGTLRGHKSRSEFVRKPPSKTFIIPADELVQVIAKDLSVSSNNMSNAVQGEKPSELLTDSSISQSYHVDRERQLQRWVPDETIPHGADLENVFDNPWNRKWNQFEVNKSLFGVKSTFDEDLYTTRLERGPQTKQLEEHAQKIAREIEAETTRDIHVAEERGLQLNENFDFDEEARYSSVRPVSGFGDSGFDLEDNALLDTCNDLTFGGSSTSDGQKPASSGKGCEELRVSGDSQSSRKNKNVDQSCSTSKQQSKDFPAAGSNISESQLDERRRKNNEEVSHNNRSAEESTSGHGDIKEGAKSGGGASSVSKAVTEREREASQVSSKTKSESSFGQSASRSSESRPGPSTSSRPGLSPSSSIGSMASSEKSTLNPNAKEFKLNPKAKSFKPLQSAAAPPQSPIADASFYYPGPSHVPVQQMPGMPPVNYGLPPYPGNQPQMMYHPQAYYHPNGQPQYPQQQMIPGQQQQQMIPGQQHPRPVYYMHPPPYPQDMPYHNKGRE